MKSCEKSPIFREKEIFRCFFEKKISVFRFFFVTLQAERVFCKKQLEIL